MSLHCGTALAPSRARAAPAPRRIPLRAPHRGAPSPRRPVAPASASASSGASSSFGASSVPAPADAPGEGRRRRPAVTDTKPHENALEPEKGPRVNSRGIAPDEVAPVVPTREAATEFPSSEWPRASDAPGEGRRRAPSPAAEAEEETKGKTLEPPRGAPVGKGE